MLRQLRDLGEIFLKECRIVRVDTGHLIGVDDTPVELVDSALAHPDEGRFLRQPMVFRQELVPHVPRLALTTDCRAPPLWGRLRRSGACRPLNSRRFRSSPPRWPGPSWA